MNTEQEREEFERHWHDFYKLGTKLARINGRYLSMPVQCAWEAWRARAALASPEVQALRKDLEQYVGIASELATENEKMRVALEMIAGMRPCPDILMGNADIARAALAAMEKQK